MVLAAMLKQRVIYAESAAKGLSVIEVAPRSEAARELGELAKLVSGERQASRASTRRKRKAA